MSEAFDCAKCSESLYGRKYIQTDDGPYCVPCYDNTFANTCAECQQLIGHDSRVRTGPDRAKSGWRLAEGAKVPMPLATPRRSCSMKTATSTRAASAAAAASAPWPTSPSLARTVSCSAMTATAAPSRRSALPAGSPSCLVRPPLRGGGGSPCVGPGARVWVGFSHMQGAGTHMVRTWRLTG